MLAVIDTPPYAADASLTAARCADMQLILCKPSAPDLNAISTTSEIARNADRPTVGLVSAAPVRDPLVAQAHETFAGYGTECAAVIIHNRIAHVHA